jgi:translation initiation factor 1
MKRKTNNSPFIYSTNPEAIPMNEEEEKQTLKPTEQKLKVVTDTKQRAGKIVTLILGFIGTSNDLEQLAKLVKTKCGTGGTVKDGQIIIQGDYTIKIKELLQQLHYGIQKK